MLSHLKISLALLIILNAAFVVERAFSGGALILTYMDGEELPSPVNSDVVK